MLYLPHPRLRTRDPRAMLCNRDMMLGGLFESRMEERWPTLALGNAGWREDSEDSSVRRELRRRPCRPATAPSSRWSFAEERGVRMVLPRMCTYSLLGLVLPTGVM